MIQPLLACLKCRKTLTIHLPIQPAGVCNIISSSVSQVVQMWQRVDFCPSGGLCSVLRPLQHSIGYMGDGF